MDSESTSMKTIEHISATIRLRENGIVFFKLKEDAVVDLEEAKEIYNITMALTRGEKYSSLVDARATISLSKEAREWSAKPELHINLIAQAIIVSSLANRIIANFIIKFNRAKAPMRLFSTEEKALEWLNDQIEIAKEKELVGDKAM